jgi:hypothetical protein
MRTHVCALRSQSFRGRANLLCKALTLAFVGTVALAGCGDGTDGEPSLGECALADREYGLDEGEVEHACRHVPDGPFGELSSGDDLDNLHLLYTVTLEEQPDGLYAGSLGFVARKSSTHVFYVFGPSALSFHDETGEQLCIAATVRELSCTEMDRAELVDLEDGQRIELRIGAQSTSTVRILAERK